MPENRVKQTVISDLVSTPEDGCAGHGTEGRLRGAAGQDDREQAEDQDARFAGQADDRYGVSFVRPADSEVGWVVIHLTLT